MFKFAPAKASAPHWRITTLAVKVLAALTKPHQLQRPEHIGMFAGSLLRRDDWDHL
jgi:hypothetical protein